MVRYPSRGKWVILAAATAVVVLGASVGAQNFFFVNGLNRFVGIGRDFRISGNEIFGIRYAGGASEYGGMYVETLNTNGWPFYGYATNGSFRAWTYFDGVTSDWHLYNAGIRLTVPNEGGIKVGTSSTYSVELLNSTGSDGIRINDTADDGIQIGSDPNYPSYGLYIPSPGVSTYGLWPNTANASGDYALFTVDNISASNVAASSVTQIARVEGDGEVLAGDVVAAAGVGTGVRGSPDMLPLVVAAGDGTRDAVIGVVKSRMALRQHPGKEGEDAESLESVPGPATRGDFVAVIIQGVTLVRADPSDQIVAGQRLTAAEAAGRARALRTRNVQGMVVNEGAATVGIALGPANGDGLVPIYVRAR
jgi:hypothetical protein